MTQEQPFLTPSTISEDINGKVFNFYSISFGCSMKMKNLAKPIVQAIAVLMADNPSDAGVIKREDITGDEQLTRSTGYQPISPEIAALRSQEKAVAVDGIVDALFDPLNKMVLCELIVDSLREEFPTRIKGLVQTSDVVTFSETVDLTVFVKLLKNVARANVESFGPLAQKLSQLAQKGLESVETQKSKSPTEGESKQPQSPPIPG